MKRTIIILLLSLPLLLDAQDKAAYRITYDCDAQYDKTPGTYRWNLDIGSETAVFYNPDYRKHTEAFQSLPETGAALHGCGQDHFHRPFQPVKLAFYYLQIFPALHRVVPQAVFQQGVTCSICHCNGCLQFMGDVLGEIVPHLIQPPAFPDGLVHHEERHGYYQQDAG